MREETTLDLNRRDEISKMLCNNFIMSQEYNKELQKAIRQYQNTNLKDETIEKIVGSSLNLKQNVHSLNYSLNHFNGYINEFLCVYEYNALKNNDSVLSVLNPDTTSKTDILHIISTSNGFIVKAGGDVKSGSPTYVLNQYEKLLTSKYDIPFIDYSGYLTESVEKSLTNSQQIKLANLMEKYPNKKPIKPLLSNLDRLTLRRDILKYLATGALPSVAKDIEWEMPISREGVLKLKIDILNKDVMMEDVNWKTLKIHSISNLKHTNVSSSSKDKGEQEKIDQKPTKNIKDEINREEEKKDIRGRVIKFPKPKKNYNYVNNFEYDEFGKIDYEYYMKAEPTIDKEIKENVKPLYKKSKVKTAIFGAGKVIKSILLEGLKQVVIDKVSNPSNRNSNYGFKTEANNPIAKELIKTISENPANTRSSPIPHKVREHPREYKTGKVTIVKEHTRGNQ